MQIVFQAISSEMRILLTVVMSLDFSDIVSEQQRYSLINSFLGHIRGCPSVSNGRGFRQAQVSTAVNGMLYCQNFQYKGSSLFSVIPKQLREDVAP